MIYIFTAMLCEAKPVIKEYSLIKVSEENIFDVYKNEKITLLITGIGKLNAVSGVSYLLKNQDKRYDILNLGICGTDIKKHSIGDLILINKISDEESKRSFYPDMILKSNTKEDSLMSCNKPVTKSYLKDKNFRESCFDMEAYGICYAALKFISTDRIHILKVVSDKLEGEHLTKEYIEGLIEENMNNIKMYIEKLSAKEEYTDRDILGKSILDAVSKNLKLTQSQYYQLRDYAKYYHIKNGNISILNKYININIQNKKQRTKIMEDLKNVLTN